ncbi:AraC family transcriptional regulator [Salinisphaera sp. LB1]|uniref:helix-turn-helix domain-containing protein n=1 Tax=Salinisphaera sp. LB1 TaxID=2183911 RepID=UPI000D7081B3|nr:AraC family transcriptional regulator [Salinisphaera sp. LB1]AWN14769.1 Transcriptional regulator, AraC family [Salinisphaera sp. LB1]
MNQTHARLNPIRRGHGEHRHAFTQLLFGLGGAVRCEMASAEFEVSTGRIGIVPCHARHFFAGRSEDSRLLVVDLFLDDDTVQQIQTIEPCAGLHELFEAPRAFAMPAELRLLIACAASQLVQVPNGSRLLAHQWATMLAVQVYQLLADRAAGTTDSKHERFQTLVDSRLASPPSNAELQRHLGMGGSALNQWFRCHYGVPPQQAVLARRLNWARDRLLQSDHSIAQIAHEIGFADAPSFTRAFVRVHGTTPGAMRRRRASDGPVRSGVEAIDPTAQPVISYRA